MIDGFLESYADRLSFCLTERYLSDCLRDELLGDILETGGLALGLTTEDVEEDLDEAPIQRWWPAPHLRKFRDAFIGFSTLPTLLCAN